MPVLLSGPLGGGGGRSTPAGQRSAGPVELNGETGVPPLSPHETANAGGFPSLGLPTQLQSATRGEELRGPVGVNFLLAERGIRAELRHLE